MYIHNSAVIAERTFSYHAHAVMSLVAHPFSPPPLLVATKKRTFLCGFPNAL